MATIPREAFELLVRAARALGDDFKGNVQLTIHQGGLRRVQLVRVEPVTVKEAK
jgi:hypothetical protein